MIIMQPCSREMQEINSLLNSSQISLQNLNNNQIQNSQLHMNQQQLTPPPHFDTTSHDDFLEQMLSNLWDPNTETTPSGSDNLVFPYDQHATLASKFLMSMPLSLPGNHVLHPTSFNSPNPGGGGGGDSLTSIQPLFNGFTGGQASNQPQHFQHPQGQNFGGATNQTPVVNGNQVQSKPRVRARRGQATDPHSIAERLRRERIAERMKALQELVPNANKTDKASMLDEIIDYVKFLQLQVKVLSMSRLGGAAAVAPLVANISSQGGGGDCIQTNGNRNGGGPLTQTTPSSTSNDSLTMTEHQVAKLMEQDMGSAMQYLQGKGLCLMPISLATAISTATCHTRNPLIPAVQSNGEGPSSPSMSVLTVQSAVSTVKDAATVSKS